MTCILAVKSKNRIILAGDRAASDGYTQSIVARPKIGKIGEGFHIGASGSFRGAQLALDGLMEHPVKPGNEYRFLLDDYIPNLFNRMATLNVATIQHNVANMPGELIAVINREIFLIQSDYSILSPVEDFVAIGSGSLPALGALSANAYMKDIEQRALKALEAASKYCLGVAPPFDFIDC